MKTRKPTGRPAWPLVLLEGSEKSGKSYAAYSLTASPNIGQAFALDIGELDADAYGAMPGADYEIIVHDGTYGQIASAVSELTATVGIDEEGRPPLLIGDSISNLWSLLCNMAQDEANARRGGTREREATITMPQWGTAKNRWRTVLDDLMQWEGIVVLTARGREVAVVGADGQPTGEKTWKVEGEKSLAYDCDVWVRLTGDRPPTVQGARSLTMGVRPGVDDPVRLPEFTLDDLLFNRLGLKVGEHGGRQGAVPSVRRVAQLTAKRRLIATATKSYGLADTDEGNAIAFEVAARYWPTIDPQDESKGVDSMKLEAVCEQIYTDALDGVPASEAGPGNDHGADAAFADSDIPF